MKNTMKKLLCMALAIMLLVSAVPVFAAADGGSGTYTVVQKQGNGADATTSSGSVTFNDGETVEDVITFLQSRGEIIDPVTRIYLVTSSGSSADRNAVLADGCTLTIRLADKPADVYHNVTVSVTAKDSDGSAIGSGTATKSVLEGTGTLTLDNALILEAYNSYVADDFNVGTWSTTGGSLSGNSLSNVTSDVTVSVTVTKKAVPVVTPTYTIRFLAYDDSVVQTLSVNENETIAAGASAAGVVLGNVLTEAASKVPATHTYGGWTYDATAPVTASADYKVNATAKKTYTLTLNANGGTFSGNKSTVTQTACENDVISVGAVSGLSRTGYQFAGWRTNPDGGTQVTEVTMTGNVTLYAEWNKVSEVKVYAAFYKNGVWMSSSHLVTLSAYSGNNLLNFLNANSGTIEARIPSGYTWGYSSSDDDDFFYTYNNDAKLTQQNEVANASKSVYIRLYSTEANTISKVLLYVHTKVGGTATVYDMKDFGYGYVPGDQVTRTQVKAVLDKKYKYTSFDGPYDDTAWSELCKGLTPTANTNGVVIPDNDDFAVHVVLKNGSLKSSGTADSSNPKTGDTIYVPMVVMGLTGTAAAAAYVFGKKRFAR